jgi:hypothetical protein
MHFSCRLTKGYRQKYTPALANTDQHWKQDGDQPKLELLISLVWQQVETKFQWLAMFLRLTLLKITIPTSPDTRNKMAINQNQK